MWRYKLCALVLLSVQMHSGWANLLDMSNQDVREIRHAKEALLWTRNPQIDFYDAVKDFLAPEFKIKLFSNASPENTMDAETTVFETFMRPIDFIDDDRKLRVLLDSTRFSPHVLRPLEKPAVEAIVKFFKRKLATKFTSEAEQAVRKALLNGWKYMHYGA